MNTERLKELWSDDRLTLQQVAMWLSTKADKVKEQARLLGLPDKIDKRCLRIAFETLDPTPEEIEERSAAVRAGWTPRQEKSRRVGSRESGLKVIKPLRRRRA